MARRPNILLLLSDQHRREAMGCYGNAQVHTPHLDALAQDGTRCDQAVSCYPLCGPFRAALQTGQHPHVNQVQTNDDEIRHDLPTLAQHFNDQGYATAFFGKGHWCRKVKPGYVKPDERLGWQHWIGWNNGHEDYDLPTFNENDNPWLDAPTPVDRPPHDLYWPREHTYATRYAPQVQTTQMQEWVEGLDDQTPWLAQVNWGPPHNISNLPGFSDPEVMDLSRRLNHELGLGLAEEIFESFIPWLTSFPQSLVSPVVPSCYLDRYDPRQLKVPPNVAQALHPLMRWQLREYYAQITALDDLVGRIRSWLETTSRDRDTLVIYTSDHGDYLGSHANPHRALITGQGIRGKGSPHACSTRVPLIAWGPGHLPSGVSLQAPIGTLDLMPTLCGLAGINPDASLPGRDLSQALYKGDEPENAPQLLGMYHWRSVYDGRFMYAVQGHDENSVMKPWLMFDRAEDPHEQFNLIDHPDHADRCNDMHLLLRNLLDEAGDPFGQP